MTEIDFDMLADLIDDGLVLVEAQKITAANGAASRMLGPKIIGRRLTDILTAPELKEQIAGAGSTEDSAECISGLKDDRFTRVRVRCAGLGDGRVAVVLSDETGAHNLEKVRRDFVANVSHELRSPLTALVGFIETMSTASPELDETTRARFLGIMDEETKRMSRLIDDLMSLSRVEVEEHIAPTDGIYIVNVVEAVVATMSNRAALEGRSIIFSDRRKDPDVSVTVLGETDEIMEVFHNLLDNALKYGEATSEIRVVLDDENARELRFDVINRGEGIPGHHMERLTERFYRVDKARSRKIGGTGLGLAIVKHIVSRHRGRLEIASGTTSGTKGMTVFSVILPKSPGALS